MVAVLGPPAVRERVLIVHNRYLHRGGEDAVVDEERKILHAHGHDVEFYERTNAEVFSKTRLRTAVESIWSRRSHAELEALIDAFKPHVVHFHNVFPTISASSIWAAHRRGVAVVQTLHNFRLVCPQAFLYRDGTICTDCVGRLPLPAVRHACYRTSRSQSLVAASVIAAHRMLGTYSRCVDRFIALTEHSKRVMIESGLERSLVTVKPNCCPDQGRPTDQLRSGGGMFVGRLSPEKGVELLLESLTRVDGPPFTIVGTGPLEELVRRHPRVDFRGLLSPAEVAMEMKRASFLVMPSVWYETFGLVIIEAYSNSLPVIASDHGAMAELIDQDQTGWLVTPGSVESLRNAIQSATERPDVARAMGARARSLYERLYTPQRNYEQLIQIYRDATRHRRARNDAAST